MTMYQNVTKITSQLCSSIVLSFSTPLFLICENAQCGKSLTAYLVMRNDSVTYQLDPMPMPSLGPFTISNALGPQI